MIEADRGVGGLDGVVATSTSRASRADKWFPSLDVLVNLSRKLGVTTDFLLTGQDTTPLDAVGAIRAEPHLNPTAKRHLIGVLNELRSTT